MMTKHVASVRIRKDLSLRSMYAPNKQRSTEGYLKVVHTRNHLIENDKNITVCSMKFSMPFMTSLLIRVLTFEKCPVLKRGVNTYNPC